MELNTNWGLLGHEWAVELLQGHLKNNRARHAYLFTGPQGIGRRTLAIRFSQALNCTKLVNDVIPCGECRACRLIDRMQHPDFSAVQSDETGKAIKVDQVRELQRSLSLAPYEASYKIELLLNFEEANQNAANALLKTLEEPPSHVIILLTTNDAEALLPTILSRCELIHLRPLKIEQVAKGLHTNLGLSVDKANLLAHISGGRPGFAQNLGQDSNALTLRDKQLDALQTLLSMTRLERFSFAETLCEEKIALQSTLQTWLTFWRDVMLRTAGSSAPLINIDREDEILRLTEKLDLATVHTIINKLERAKDQIDKYINPRLVTEVLMLDIPQIA